MPNPDRPDDFLQIYEPPTMTRIGASPEQLVARQNLHNAIATLGWVLVLILTSTAPALVVLAYRTAF